MNRFKTIGIIILSVGALLMGHVAFDMHNAKQWDLQLQGPQKDFHVTIDPMNSGRAPCSTEKIFYQNGRMTGKLVYWNNQPWERTLVEYHDELSLYSVQTMVYQDEKISIIRKDIFQTSRAENQADQKIETWYYNFGIGKPNTLRQVDTYIPSTSLVKERQVFDEFGSLKATATIDYNLKELHQGPDKKVSLPPVTGMKLTNDEGHIVSDYKEIEHVDILELYTQYGFSHEEIAHRVRVAQDPSRTKIAVLDGGVDISHPELAYKLWKNPKETPNGIDDDGDGLVDNIYGITDNPNFSQPIFDLRLPRYGLPDFSHGTLVASIATHGREDASIISISEITTVNSKHLLPKVTRFLNHHGVRFTNMSFIIDKQLMTFGPHAQRPGQIADLVEQTPDTLHVVAAGNGASISGKGFNVDKYRLPGDLVPVMLPHDNILVVGAINTNQLRLSDYPSYQATTFSNVGELSVDILAPGKQICGARMGGDDICVDGTSFAAPYLLNHGVLDVANANPYLNIYEIKEILLKTAYIPDLDYPFPVRSGGILHPWRAVAAAKWLFLHPQDTVETAAIAVRKAEAVPLPGERNDEAYLNALKSFWALRQLSPATTLYASAQDDYGLNMQTLP